MKYEIVSTSIFDQWLNNLKDRVTRNKVLARLARIESGNLGDFKLLGNGLFELRFFFANGLRIYFAIKDSKVILLLNGGNKSNQSKDIEKARKILDELE
jgi:putative addiction module killer protein